MNHLKYRKVEAELRQLARALPVGARLPPERELAVTCGCNFLTVRRALKELVDDGTITRRIGSGTFIAPKKEQENEPMGDLRVGLLVYPHSDDYGQQLLRGIAHACLEDRIDVRSAWVRDFVQDGVRVADSLKQAGCVSLCIPWFPIEMAAVVARFLRLSSLPVSIPLLIPGFEQNYFGEPELFGESVIQKFSALCRYFSFLGHRRIALLGPASASNVVLHRMLGAYACYTSENGLPNLSRLVPRTAGAMDRLAAEWAEFRGKLAVICYDDEHALRFMTAMHKIGLSAPKDFAIVGNNNTDASHFSDPPLSSMQQNFTEVGRGLIRHALALSRGETEKWPDSRAVLVVRATCGGMGRIEEKLAAVLPELDVREETAELAPPSEYAAPEPAVA